MFKKPIIVQVKDLGQGDVCSVEPMYGLAEWSALAAAHMSRSINIEDECWFGVAADYPYAPGTAYACKLIEVDSLDFTLLESEKTLYAAAYAAALSSEKSPDEADSIALKTVFKLRWK